MTDRILPYQEWGRLAHTPLGAVVHGLDPAKTAVVVIEDDDGEIIGCWAVVPMLCAEGAWIDLAHRKHGAVARRLLRGVGRVALGAGHKAVFSVPSNQAVHDTLRHRRYTTAVPEGFLIWVS